MIYAYEGISKDELIKLRFTSEGHEYTLSHSESLIVSMRYKGDNHSNANSQGWERNSTYYFKELKSRNPEFFSKKNTNRIEKGEAPVVDSKFCEYFPEYSSYKNEVLIHHHIGKNGQAVAVPASIHKGSGEIHIFENQLGITENAKKFSLLCSGLLDKEIAKNKTADQLHIILEQKKGDEIMTKKLVLFDNNGQPSKEEFMRIGEEAIDKHMEILRDEMRNEGMSDGPEMESIIHERKSESMAELYAGVYGVNHEINNSFEEASDFSPANGLEDYKDNSFEEASDFIPAEGLGHSEDNPFKEASSNLENGYDSQNRNDKENLNSLSFDRSESIEQNR